MINITEQVLIILVYPIYSRYEKIFTKILEHS